MSQNTVNDPTPPLEYAEVSAQPAPTETQVGNPIANAEPGSGDPSQIPSSSTQNTVLGDDIPSMIDSSLTAYRDVDIPVEEVPSLINPPLVDGNFAFPPGYFRVIERSIPILDQPLTNADPSLFPYQRLDLVSSLLMRPFIAERLAAATYIRYDLEIQMKVLATNYHYGQLMWVWRSAYAPLLKGQWNFTYDSDTSQCVPKPPHIDFTPIPFSEEFVTPYDSVHTASQVPHVLQNVTATTTVKMDVGWNVPYQYVPTTRMLMPEHHPGYLDLYFLTPIAPSNLDVPHVQIFARLKNIRGYGYRANNSPSTQLSTVYPAAVHYYRSAQHIGWDALKVPLPQSTVSFNKGGLELATGTWVDIRTQNPAEALGTPLQQTATDLNLIVMADRAQARADESTLLKTSNAVFSFFGEKVSQATTLLSSVGKLFGMGACKPPEKDLPMRLISYGMPMSSSVASDLTVSSALSPVSQVGNLSSSPAVDIATLCATPTYLGFYRIESGKALYLPVHPYYVHSISDYLYATLPATYLASRFRYWRGSCKFHFHFCVSSFTTARVLITFTYNGSPADVGFVPSQIVELKGDTDCDFVIPFLHSEAWASAEDIAPTFDVTISLFGSAISAQASATPPLFMTAWQSWEGFQVSGLVPMKFSLNPYLGAWNHVPPVSKQVSVISGGDFPTPRKVGRVLHSLGESTTEIKSMVEDVSVEEPNLAEYQYKSPVVEKTQALVLPSLSLSFRETFLLFIPTLLLSFISSCRKLFKCCVRSRPKERTQSGAMVPGSLPFSSRSMDWGMNDIPTSLFHIGKRFALYSSNALRPFYFNLYLYRNPQNKASPYLAADIVSTYSLAFPLFRWMKGSVCAISNTANLYDVPLTFQGETPALRANIQAGGWYGSLSQLCSWFWRGSNGWSVMRQPYRSDTSYVSTPMGSSLCVWNDPANTKLGLKYQFPIPTSYACGPSQSVPAIIANENPANIALSMGDDFDLAVFYGVPALILATSYTIGRSAMDPKKDL